MMDPDNDLYDAACDMLAAGQRLSHAAAADGVAPTLPATLGCIAASLGALTVGCAVLGSDARPSQRSTFDDLVHALRGAHSACETARSGAASGHPASACQGDAPRDLSSDGC
jgi:hypothetical protein